jgi:hypothetical protein
MISVFPKSLKTPQKNKLENITLRDLGGGWNAIENDLQMQSSYLVTVRNFRRTAGGTQKLRFGSRWFADLDSIAGTGTRIVDMEYFTNNFICVLDNGEVAAVDETGTGTIIWNAAIAAALPGAPSAWGSTFETVDFVPYKAELIIHNGVDKPITIDSSLAVTYLQDLATGSNVNTPIGRYGCVVQNYHVIAGVDATPTQVYVSAVGTAGTFFGDPAPNDSIVIDIGAYAPQGAVEIRGIAGFRGNLIAFFLDQAVIVRLGAYDSGVHTPTFPDTMPTFGILSHRSMVTIENDLIFAGVSGVYSAKRNLFNPTDALEGVTLSERIEPAYRETIASLGADQSGCWMVFDALSHDVLLFTPTNRTFVYSYNTKLKYSAWSEYSDINVQCGAKSFLGRLFYADGLRIYQHGNTTFEGEAFERDRLLDRDGTWATLSPFQVDSLIFDPDTELVYRCLLGHLSGNTTFADDRALVPPLWQLYEGIDFTFQIELPWLDSKDPMRVKFLRFIAMASKGDARFTVNAYVDNLFKNVDGDIVFNPALSMNFVGNEAVGFGYDAGPYGGGRRSDDPRLWKFPVKFKKLKLTLNGTRGGMLELVNMSFLFSRGRYKR